LIWFVFVLVFVFVFISQKINFDKVTYSAANCLFFGCFCFCGVRKRRNGSKDV